MSIFGNRWANHAEQIERHWRALITPDDTVVIPGDISWAMKLDETAEDFRFIESLPGRKIIGKGNHDYWWTTVTKMKSYLSLLGVSSVDFLQNNAFLCGNAVICGSRGWYIEEKLQNTPSPTDYEKIVRRECQRLELSLTAGERLLENSGVDAQLIVFLHFPPYFCDFVCESIINTLLSHDVCRCYYGHIHGKYNIPQSEVYRGITFTLISSDYLGFIPQKVFV